MQTQCTHTHTDTYTPPPKHTPTAALTSPASGFIAPHKSLGLSTRNNKHTLKIKPRAELLSTASLLQRLHQQTHLSQHSSTAEDLPLGLAAASEPAPSHSASQSEGLEQTTLRGSGEKSEMLLLHQILQKQEQQQTPGSHIRTSDGSPSFQSNKQQL